MIWIARMLGGQKTTYVTPVSSNSPNICVLSFYLSSTTVNANGVFANYFVYIYIYNLRIFFKLNIKSTATSSNRISNRIKYPLNKTFASPQDDHIKDS